MSTCSCVSVWQEISIQTLLVWSQKMYVIVCCLTHLKPCENLVHLSIHSIYIQFVLDESICQVIGANVRCIHIYLI